MLFPSPGDLPNTGIEPESLVSPTLAGGFFTTASPRKPYQILGGTQILPFVFVFFFFLAMWLSMQDLSSLTRGGTRVLTTGLPMKYPNDTLNNIQS